MENNQEIVVNLSRRLTYRCNGKLLTGELLIENILYVPERNVWKCRWSLTLIKESIEAAVFGDDPLEALICALQQAASLIKDSGYDDLTVWWRYEGDNGALDLSVRI